MKRTRKWAYVAQEARRLADLGLSPSEIAGRLEVHPSSVQRWMAAGKLRDTRGTAPDRPGVPTVASSGAIGAEAWAAAVRAAYALDSTDDQLVDLATRALAVAKDLHEAASVRLVAMGRFQGLVKQLGLVARAPVTDAPPPPPPEPARPARGPRVDPRGQLMLQ
jgi:hypothetical protein